MSTDKKLSEGTLDEVSSRAKQAWCRLKETGRQMWEDWKQIGVANHEASTDIMRTLRLNTPNGKGSQRDIKAWREKYELTDIDKSVWSNLDKLVVKIVAVETWRNSLPLHEQIAWSHPNTVWRHYLADQAKEKAKAGEPSEAKLKKLSNAQALREAKAEMMQLRERIKEVEEEADGSTIVSQTTAKEAFEMLSRLWPEAKCRQLAKLLTKGDYPK
jgi:hypothetical protein